MSLLTATVPISREVYQQILADPNVNQREQMRSYCHLTELRVQGVLVAVRTITASNTVYMGVKS